MAAAPYRTETLAADVAKQTLRRMRKLKSTPEGDVYGHGNGQVLVKNRSDGYFSLAYYVGACPCG